MWCFLLIVWHKVHLKIYRFCFFVMIDLAYTVSCNSYVTSVNWGLVEMYWNEICTTVLTVFENTEHLLPHSELQVAKMLCHINRRCRVDLRILLLTLSSGRTLKRQCCYELRLVQYDKNRDKGYNTYLFTVASWL